MKSDHKIAVIGAGSWGTTVANLLAEKGFNVSLWAREEEVVKSINNTNENIIFLKGIKLSKRLKAYSDITRVLPSEIVIMAVPTQNIRTVLKPYGDRFKRSYILSLSKGIEIETFKRPSEIIYEITKRDVYALSGPNFAIEIAMKKPSATTIAGRNKKVRKFFQNLLSTEYFRIYENDDIIGTEIGGAVKNIIAIAAGIIDAIDLGHNAKAALITRGLNEIRLLGKKLGARDMTFLGLSGIGDLILTCNSNISRNYSVGYRIGSGEKIESIISRMKQVAEGVKTVEAIYKLSKKLSIDMPITGEVYEIIYLHKKVEKAVKALMTRTLKSEF